MSSRLNENPGEKQRKTKIRRERARKKEWRRKGKKRKGEEKRSADQCRGRGMSFTCKMADQKADHCLCTSRRERGSEGHDGKGPMGLPWSFRENSRLKKRGRGGGVKAYTRMQK